MREDAQGFALMSGRSQYLPVVISFVSGLLFFVLVTPDFSEGTGQSLEIIQRRAYIETSLHVLVTFCLGEYGLHQSNHL